MKAKLSDIARLAGVSKSTASRALRNSSLVKDETKKLVLETAKMLNYKPNSLARAMATKRTKIIGFLMYKKNKPYVSHTFFGPILDGAIEEAAKRDYHIIVAATNDMADTFNKHFIQDSIDGALLVSLHPEEVIKEFDRRGIPLVVINNSMKSRNNAFIEDDNYGGACAVMEHLIRDRGHTRIAHITENRDHPSYRVRYKAFLDMHAKYGIPVFDGVVLADSAASFEDGYNAMKDLLLRKTLPTAVFAATDVLAIGAMHAIKDAGLRIPDDIAVAGYDDISAAFMVDPPLTTVRVDREQIGKAAIIELMKQIEDPEKPSRVVTISNELVIRAST